MSLWCGIQCVTVFYILKMFWLFSSNEFLISGRPMVIEGVACEPGLVNILCSSLHQGSICLIFTIIDFAKN